jgi:hypothetical protein
MSPLPDELRRYFRSTRSGGFQIESRRAVEIPLVVNSQKMAARTLVVLGQNPRRLRDKSGTNAGLRR